MPSEKRRTSTVVVVDDLLEFLELMEDVLGGEGGYRVVPVVPQRNIVERIRRAEPSLVIVDLRLGAPPDAEAGWRLVTSLRAEPDLSAIPLLVCSADVQQLRGRLAQILSMPRTDYLAKPFELASLLDKVEHLIGQGSPEPFIAPLAVLVAEAGSIIDASGDVMTLLGYSPEEMVGMRAPDRRAVARGRLRRKDGSLAELTLRAHRTQLGESAFEVTELIGISQG